MIKEGLDLVGDAKGEDNANHLPKSRGTECE